MADERPEPTLTMDLRGMKYPATLKETKACLLQVPVRDVLELYVDDARSVRDMPVFLKDMGHDVWIDDLEAFSVLVVRKNKENY